MALTEVSTTKHQWVGITIAPIHVLPSEDGPVIIGDPDPGETHYGCNKCSEPLEGNFGTECNPE